MKIINLLTTLKAYMSDAATLTDFEKRNSKYYNRKLKANIYHLKTELKIIEFS